MLVLCSGCDAVLDLSRPDAVPDASLADPGCPNNFVGHYLFVNEPTSKWRTAEADCELLSRDAGNGKYVHLAVIGSAQEAVNVQEQLFPDLKVSVGLSDRVANTTNMMPDTNRANYLWVTAEAVGLPPWKSDNPNSTSDAPFCGTLDGGEIDDSGCETEHPYLCECDEFPADGTRIDPPL